MGWNDWNTFGCGISDSVVRQTADAMATNGMKAAGYQFVNIDDCWASGRDANGVVVVNSSKFPNGIKALADYVHTKGLKLGLYTDHGTNTCSGSNPPGSFGYEYLDAMTYASWGVDYLKNDSCKLPPGDIPYEDYFRMADGLKQSGRPIVVSICQNAAHYEYWSADLGNLWRTTGDIHDTFANMVGKIDPNSKSAYVAGPGRWNDPDMLEVGNNEFATNVVAARAHFSMWCIMAAPLIAGNDIRSASAQTLAVLTNPEAIAVDQDPAGEQGVRVAGTAGSTEVWSKPLGYDFTTRAVALFNRTASDAAITCVWTNLALQSGLATVRDLWAHADLGTFTNSFTTNVPAHGVVLLKVVGTPLAPPPLGTDYLSDLQPIYAYTGFGTLTKDKSIGGNTITLNGVTYSKGIGTHAIGGHEYDLGGIVARFQSDLGVDDESGSAGSVIFQVFADGTKIYDSGIMTGSSATKAIDLDVRGVRRLTLGVTDTGNDVSGNRNSNDHSDWAGARVIVTNIVPVLPSAPTGLSASAGKGITLSWNPVLSAVAYSLKRSLNSGGPYSLVTNTLVTTFTDGAVGIGTNYYYVVSAHNSFGDSTNSLEASVTPCNLPAIPTNLMVTVSNAQAVVKWNASAGATGYLVRRFTGKTPLITVASGLTATNFTDATVVPGTTYFYLVAATNTCNGSGLSGFVAANIPAPAPPPPPLWNGGSAVGSYWNDVANWGGTNITPGNSLLFGGNIRLNNTNDTPTSTSYSAIRFNPGAGAFRLNGNAITLTGNITNNSSNPQLIRLALNFSNSLVLSGASGTLTIGGGLTNTLGAAGFTTLTLSGAGILTNLLNSANNPGGTNVIALSGPSSAWTLLDNPVSAAMTAPWVFSINQGTFNFGSASSAPVLTVTTPNNSPSDHQAGTVAGATGTFNMMGGTLTTSARLNTATALNSTGVVNQIAGTFNLGSQFQGANGANAGEASIVNASGGTMNISSGSGPFYVASRGSGTLNVSGSVTINCGTLDVSRNANGNAIGSVGVVNLNGGTVLASKIGTATANAQTSILNGPTATFYFNGGTLKINSSITPFFQGSTVPPVIPILAIVKSGGAIVDTNGKTNVFAEPLLHDGNLGSNADGGLTKNGAGSLILLSNVSYTGSTTVNAGVLVLSNDVALNTSPTITIAASAVLDASGRTDGTLTLASGQTLRGHGLLQGTAIISNGAILAPGLSIGTLTVSSNLTLAAGSTIVMELSTSPMTNDALQVGGTVTYGGTLIATHVSGTALAVGDSFKFFNAASYGGAFTNIVPPMPGSGLAWNVSGLASNGVLQVVAASPPRISASLLNGSSLVLSGTGGIPNGEYYVLASTNLILPLSNWTRIATNRFDADGNSSFTNAMVPGRPQQFYLLRLP
jgi:alpha-galactosidase